MRVLRYVDETARPGGSTVDCGQAPRAGSLADQVGACLPQVDARAGGCGLSPVLGCAPTRSSNHAPCCPASVLTHNGSCTQVGACLEALERSGGPDAFLNIKCELCGKAGRGHSTQWGTRWGWRLLG